MEGGLYCLHMCEVCLCLQNTGWMDKQVDSNKTCVDSWRRQKWSAEFFGEQKLGQSLPIMLTNKDTLYCKYMSLKLKKQKLNN